MSQFGFLPRTSKTAANAGSFEGLDGDVIYAAPTQLVRITTEATAAAVTYTAQAVLGGLILRDPAGGARTDVLPTAALIIAAARGAVVGMGVRLIIRNTADAAELITMNVGATGLTSATGNTLTIAQNATAEYLLVFTNVIPGSEAISVWVLASDHTH